LEYSFGEWVRRRRKGLDITQQELARRVGCSVSAIFKIEADQRRPSLQVAELLADNLQISPEQRPSFIKIARQQKAVTALDSIQPLPEPIPQSASNRHHGQLPLPPSPIIGREHEISMLLQQLKDPACRLLTLTGPGGAGKTRLALEVGNQAPASFTDGVYFVSLAGTSSASFLLPALAGVLGLALKESDHQKDQVFSFLREKQALLIMDNLEHLLEGVSLLSELLQAAAGLKILATSREQLNLQAEWAFSVQGLPVPTDVDPARAASNSAVSLFLQRARQARLDFTPQPEDYASITRICQLVEGLPLGLELAASWLRALSCKEISEEIEKNIDFLRASAKDIPERHRSMRAVFDYSWQMLSGEEQHAMLWLSVFRGGFTREAASSIAGATLEMLSRLVDKSLLQHSQPRRYEMHELIRQYAYEKLAAGPHLEQASRQHFEFFLQLVQDSRTKLRGPEQLEWLSCLDEDHDNIRAALEWSLQPAERQADIPDHMRLAGALYVYWKARSRWAEGRHWLERSLALSQGTPASREKARAINAAVLLAAEQTDTQPARQLAEENLALAEQLQDKHSIARALYARAAVLWKQKDYAAAFTDGLRALSMFRELGYDPSTGRTLQLLGRIALNQNDLERAKPYLEEALQVFKEAGDHLNYGGILSDLGLLAYLYKDYPAARSYNEQSLELFRAGENVAGIEMSLNRLGDVARCQNDYAEAERRYSESMRIFREAGDKDEIASLLHNLGCVRRQQGAYPEALALFKEGLAIQSALNNQAGMAECIAGIAGVLVLRGEPEEGARLFGAAEKLRDRTNTVLWPANQLEYDRLQEILSKPRNKEKLAAAWGAGRALSAEQAAAEANRS
jgi:predicted ATPase/DNA-binding XRE family transcriptional regulator